MSKEEVRAHVQCILVHDRLTGQRCKLYQVGEKFKKANFGDRDVLVHEWLEDSGEWRLKSVVKF